MNKIFCKILPMNIQSVVRSQQTLICSTIFGRKNRDKGKNGIMDEEIEKKSKIDQIMSVGGP